MTVLGCVWLCAAAVVLLKWFAQQAERRGGRPDSEIWQEIPLIRVMTDMALQTAQADARNGSGDDGRNEDGDTQNGESGGGRPEYPAPEYPFRTEEVTIAVPGASREYTLAWVSDVHMITDQEPADGVMGEFTDTLKQRYELLFVTKDEEPVHSADLWPEIVRFLNYGGFDGIVFGGDMMDYCSRSNMDAFMRGYGQIDPNVPLLYIRADHDYGVWYGGEAWTKEDAAGLHRTIDGDAPDEKYLDFGEFIVIGINASTGNMPLEQYEFVRELYDRGKPVIIATHVPYASWIDTSLEELSMEVRGVKYYWGDGSYIADQITWSYLTEMIYSADTSVCGVLAGHLHAGWDGPLTERVSQHIFTPAFQGVIGIIRIVPEE